MSHIAQNEAGPGEGEKLSGSLEVALRFAVASGAWVIAERISAPGKPSESIRSPAISSRHDPDALDAVRRDLADCRRCRLCETRTQIVFGVGDAGATVMFVGEAPGEEEDRRGEPFVGRAGRLLNLMIEAVGMERRRVYIANVLKCRPPRNRDPAADEVACCSPFLWRQIESVGPRVVCTLGNHATRTILGVDSGLGTLRGRAHTVRGQTVLPTYHPAYLLRNPLAKRSAWRDLQTLRSLLAG